MRRVIINIFKVVTLMLFSLLYLLSGGKVKAFCNYDTDCQGSCPCGAPGNTYWCDGSPGNCHSTCAQCTCTNLGPGCSYVSTGVCEGDTLSICYMDSICSCDSNFFQRSTGCCGNGNTPTPRPNTPTPNVTLPPQNCTQRYFCNASTRSCLTPNQSPTNSTYDSSDIQCGGSTTCSYNLGFNLPGVAMGNTCYATQAACDAACTPLPTIAQCDLRWYCIDASNTCAQTASTYDRNTNLQCGGGPSCAQNLIDWIPGASPKSCFQTQAACMSVCDPAPLPTQQTSSCSIPSISLISVNVGSSTPVNPVVTASLGASIVRVTFQMFPGSVKASVCANGTSPCNALSVTYTDLAATFNADLTGIATGNTVLGITGVTNLGDTCTRNVQVSVSAAPVQGWWQVIGGDALAGNTLGTTISSAIPATCTLPTCNPVLINSLTLRSFADLKACRPPERMSGGNHIWCIR